MGKGVWIISVWERHWTESPTSHYSISEISHAKSLYLVGAPCALYRKKEDQFPVRVHSFASLARWMQLKIGWHIFFQVFSDRIWQQVLATSDLCDLCSCAPTTSLYVYKRCSPIWKDHSHYACVAFLISVRVVDIARMSILLCCCSGLIVGHWEILLLIWLCVQSSNSAWAKFPAGKKGYMWVCVSAKMCIKKKPKNQPKRIVTFSLQNLCDYGNSEIF